MAPLTFRRVRSSTSYTEWHFSRRCTKWPEKDYDIAYSEPHTGRICRECLRIQGTPQKQW